MKMEKIVEIENPGIITDYAFKDTAFVKLTTNDLWEIRMQYPHLHMQSMAESTSSRRFRWYGTRFLRS